MTTLDIENTGNLRDRDRDPMHARMRAVQLTVATLLCLAPLLTGCGAAHTPGGGSDSETHFLRACDDDCPGDLQCICGICSVTCDPASDCSDTHARSSCVAASDFSSAPLCESMATPSVCDVTCSESSDCRALSASHTCEAGRCRAKAQDPATVCRSGGKTYEPGDSWNDGCNQCACDDAGQSVCTVRDCADTCLYEGKTYQAGDAFPAGDGCNTCSCQANGEVACTLIGCPASSCDLPFEAGPCEAAIPVFWHNPVTGQCEPQTYGGCQGNDNRFETLQACRSACNVPPGGDTACRVGGVDYPSGATVPDPFSCNSCTCDNGSVSACTEIGCETPCPPNAVPGSSCAQCGLAGGCAVMETGCMRVCSDDAHCPEDKPFCDTNTNHCVMPACI